MKTACRLLLILLLPISLSALASSQPFYDFDGNPKAIQDYFVADKWTVVMIWRHDCHVCNEEVAEYSFYHEDNPLAQVVGLSIDGMKKKDKAQTFIDNHQLSFKNMIGEIAAVAGYYNSNSKKRFLGTPTFMLFNPQGKLMATHAGALPADAIDRYIKSKMP